MESLEQTSKPRHKYVALQDFLQDSSADVAKAVASVLREYLQKPRKKGEVLEIEAKLGTISPSNEIK